MRLWRDNYDALRISIRLSTFRGTWSNDPKSKGFAIDRKFRSWQSRSWESQEIQLVCSLEAAKASRFSLCCSSWRCEFYNEPSKSSPFFSSSYLSSPCFGQDLYRTQSHVHLRRIFQYPLSKSVSAIMYCGVIFERDL